jgi:hypothetical protein
VVRAKEEKIFDEQLDRALAGQPVQIPSGADEDLRTALEFSRLMVTFRAEPSLRLKTELKADLLQKLVEQEELKAAKRAWFWKVLPREPIWQAAAVLACILIAGGILWSTLFQTGTPEKFTIPDQSAPAQPPATSEAGGAYPSLEVNQYLSAEARTDKSIYQSGEPVKIEVSWKNLTGQDLTVDEFPPIVSLMETSDSRAVHTFASGKQSLVLKPGESAGYTFIWDQRDAAGNLVKAGNYYIELEEMYYNDQAVKMNLSHPVNFNIAVK